MVPLGWGPLSNYPIYTAKIGGIYWGPGLPFYRWHELQNRNEGSKPWESIVILDPRMMARGVQSHPKRIVFRFNHHSQFR